MFENIIFSSASNEEFKTLKSTSIEIYSRSNNNNNNSTNHSNTTNNNNNKKIRK